MACMNPNLFDAAKTLIELGANVNAYCLGEVIVIVVDFFILLDVVAI